MDLPLGAMSLVYLTKVFRTILGTVWGKETMPLAELEISISGKVTLSLDGRSFSSQATNNIRIVINVCIEYFILV